MRVTAQAAVLRDEGGAQVGAFAVGQWCQEDMRSARHCTRRLGTGSLSGRHVPFDNGQHASVR